MGHIRLGELPKSRKWRQVFEELSVGADAASVAASVARAAEAELKAAATDDLLVETFRLLALIPVAARGPVFAADLARLGISPNDTSTLSGIVTAMQAALDRFAFQEGRRTDIGEIAELSAAEALTGVAGMDIPSMFEPAARDVQRALGRLASGDRFARLARTFFAVLSRRILQYYLSRELGNHVGAGRRFASDQERARFDAAVDQHCWEASRIVEEFAGGWYGKALYQKGSLEEAEVRRFLPVAFRKLRAEFEKRLDAA